VTNIRFHVGAHKTATTHLQLTLANCRLAPGTRYVPLRRLRATLTSPVRKHRPRLPWHRWHDGTWLFSDENIIGTTLDSPKLYPDPARALRYFLDSRLSIFLCLRAYDTFLAAAYCERLWRSDPEPFDAQLPSRRWPDVVRDMQRDLPGVPVQVWRYEDYRDNAAAIARYYAGGTIETLGPPLQQDPKSGFSGRAVAATAQISKLRPRRPQVIELRERYPVGDEYPRFNPWSAGQQSRLQEMYAEDLVEIERLAELWSPAAHSPKR
jgi:hypothetical protein